MNNLDVTSSAYVAIYVMVYMVFNTHGCECENINIVKGNLGKQQHKQAHVYCNCTSKTVRIICTQTNAEHTLTSYFINKTW